MSGSVALTPSNWRATSRVSAKDNASPTATPTIVSLSEAQHQNPALAFLTYDGEHHRFAFANLNILRPGATEADRGGLVGVDHVAYTYASLNDLLEN